MKKTLKIAAFVAAAMMGLGFVSCANDDAEDLGTLLIVKDYQEKKEAEAAAAAAAAKAASSSSDGSETASSSLPSPYTLSLSTVKEKGKITSDTKIDDTVSALCSGNKIGTKTIQGFDAAVKISANAVSYTDDVKYGIQLTLPNKADIKITALAKKGAKTTDSAGKEMTWKWRLIDESNTATTYDSAEAPIAATVDLSASATPTETPTELNFSDIPAGTYVLGGAQQGGYLYSLVITYKE